ncbi:MAG: RES family NAD+ phosphorylase [Acidobacteriaceae bacterium]
MTFNAKQQRAIKRWISRAAPIKGFFFRSVEYRYMDPIDVLSGAGAQAYGGRFAPIGTRAVYLSVTDSGASKEVTARKSRLGGIGQISIDKYPRVVYAVTVDLKKALDLSTLGSSQAAEAVRATCLDKNDLRPSMDLARELITAGIEGLVFPSVVGGDDNLIVYRANCGRKALFLQNEREVIDQVRRIAGRHKPPIPEIVKQLVGIIGRKLTAYVGGVRDVRAVDRWMKGGEIYGDAEQRLRFAFQLVRMLAEREDRTVIQSWLTGVNPELGDRVPLRLIRENDLETVAAEIMGAARAFLVGG